jgi:hypothetical protein
VSERRVRKYLEVYLPDPLTLRVDTGQRVLNPGTLTSCNAAFVFSVSTQSHDANVWNQATALYHMPGKIVTSCDVIVDSFTAWVSAMTADQYLDYADLWGDSRGRCSNCAGLLTTDLPQVARHIQCKTHALHAGSSKAEATECSMILVTYCCNGSMLCYEPVQAARYVQGSLWRPGNHRDPLGRLPTRSAHNRLSSWTLRVRLEPRCWT